MLVIDIYLSWNHFASSSCEGSGKIPDNRNSSWISRTFILRLKRKALKSQKSSPDFIRISVGEQVL
ncbi:hypothetical protein KY290_020703 [Solanum tuberosum]|uniref:Uncharacterized protein n=1 Tax=Solanum tuberosum TaxID=4113 RepID=A0ABQ7V2I2_SOLTU|nr:hypothetical protein KY284_021101 [Solanum tuberosum]KAH0726663.1 hypothetical protein KY284_002528 [Solanum tuberosum]KAH0733268.1 hypothetical protein KY289_004456 [Solanum tuberosum]KAH0757210.1 hypothetical protein KY290_020703 [Solanum tuberosum]KAH0766505.1 hypothetical protein KY285_002376 [Solanum tuberosum]